MRKLNTETLFRCLPRFVLWLRIEWLEWRISRIEARGVGNFSPWNADLDKHGELTGRQVELMKRQQKQNVKT
jgi:hypothetical protein